MHDGVVSRRRSAGPGAGGPPCVGRQRVRDAVRDRRAGDAIAAGRGVVVVRGPGSQLRPARASTAGGSTRATGADRGVRLRAARAQRRRRAGAASGAIAIAGTRLYVGRRSGVRVASTCATARPCRGRRRCSAAAVHALAAATASSRSAAHQARATAVAREQPRRVRPAHRRGASRSRRAARQGRPSTRRRPDVTTLARSAACSTRAGVRPVGGTRAATRPRSTPSAARAAVPAGERAQVRALAPSGDTLYVGGAPGTLGARPDRRTRRRVARDGRGAAVRARPGLRRRRAGRRPAPRCTPGGCFGLRSYRASCRSPGPRSTAVCWRCARTARAASGWRARVRGRQRRPLRRRRHAAGRRARDRRSRPRARPRRRRPCTSAGASPGMQDAPRVNVGRVALVGGSVGAFNPRPERHGRGARTAARRRSGASAAPSARTWERDHRRCSATGPRSRSGRRHDAGDEGRAARSVEKHNHRLCKSTLARRNASSSAPRGSRARAARRRRRGSADRPADPLPQGVPYVKRHGGPAFLPPRRSAPAARGRARGRRPRGRSLARGQRGEHAAGEVRGADAVAREPERVVHRRAVERARSAAGGSARRRSGRPRRG